MASTTCEDGQIVTRTADFPRRRIVPTGAGIATWRRRSRHQRLADARVLGSAVPGRPSRIRPQDERVLGRSTRRRRRPSSRLRGGQRLWRSRYGAVTSSATGTGRRAGDACEKRSCRGCAAVDPLALGLTVRSAGRGSDASRGAHRLRRILRLLQFLPGRVRAGPRGAVLQAGCRAARARSQVCCARSASSPRTCGGSSWAKRCCWPSLAASSACSARVAYASAIMFGLRTWWVDAVGTAALTLHVTPTSLWPAGRRRCRRGRLHLVDAAGARSRLGAEPAGGRLRGG